MTLNICWEHTKEQNLVTVETLEKINIQKDCVLYAFVNVLGSCMMPKSMFKHCGRNKLTNKI